MTLDFWFEFGSTYTYPSAARLREIAAAAGVTVSWQPFLLGPIFRDQGWNDSPFNLYPAKGSYMWRDIERVCDGHALPWTRPSVFPRNGLLAARIACAAHDAHWLPDFVVAVFAANFAFDREIAEADVLLDILHGLGVDGGPWLERAQDRATKDRLRAQTDRARELGIFGAPSFVAGGELFWGNDRLGDAIAWALGGNDAKAT